MSILKKDLSLKELKSMLSKSRVPWKKWDPKSGTKSIHDLFEEISREECTLTVWRRKILRNIKVVRIIVVCISGESGRTKFLKEEEIIFPNGQIVRRNLNTSIQEKHIKGEKLTETARRALREEIGIEGVPSRKPGSMKIITDSNSYPGLKTKYTFFDFFYFMPEDQFRQDGYKEEKKDGRTIHFRWHIVKFRRRPLHV